jgi:hypothetical protein
VELDRYCTEHHLGGHESEHGPPFLPHRITIYTELGATAAYPYGGNKLAEASGWTPELAATAMLRRLNA